MTTHTEIPTHVSVEWIMKNVTASVDGYNICAACGSDEICDCESTDTLVDWESLVDYKFGDCGEEFIDSLIDEGITWPLCIVFDSDRNTFAQGNGHHRLSVAILAVMESVPVLFSFDKRDYMLSELTGEYAGWER